MSAELRELTEIGRRRQARRFVVIAAFLGLVALITTVVAADPTTQVGAVVLAIMLMSVLLGLLLAYRLFFRVPGPELAFAGLPGRRRRDLMKRLLKGGEIDDDELQVADGLLTTARRPLLPWLFGFNAAIQIPYGFGHDPVLHGLAAVSNLCALIVILLRRRQLARRTDVVTRAYKQRYDLP